LLRAQEKIKRRPAKWDEQIERLILQIEDLNDQMAAFGMPEESRADARELRAKYAPPEEEEGDPEDKRKDDDGIETLDEKCEEGGEGGENEKGEEGEKGEEEDAVEGSDAKADESTLGGADGLAEAADGEDNPQ
jgi:hypothetical protein